LAPIGFECKEAVVDHVPDNTSTKTFRYTFTDAQHLKATYGLTCHQTDDRVVFSLVRANSEDPAGIEWSIPIKELYESILIKVLDDGTLKLIGLPDNVVPSKIRLQL
jgi:hypothetical protein